MSEKSMSKITHKYHCMVSGEKRMSPCSGCSTPKGCVSRSMQYKEGPTMNEKAIVKISADGEVVKCAKGADVSACGYKAGDKVCAKCGAMAVEEKAKASAPADMEDPEKEMMDGEMEDEMEDESDDEEEMASRRMKARKRRMHTMGYKSDEWDDNSFICSFERKMYPGGANVCDSCPGGCAPEEGLPSLLDIEGSAEEMFSGKVLDSGYDPNSDLYVVDIERKDGVPVEVIFDGTTGECWSWHRLAQRDLGEKSAEQRNIINFNQAAMIAVKSIDGEVIAVDPEIFEGHDSYAVEIEGTDGVTYDVYVGLDGQVLGYDEYHNDFDDADAVAAEVALKRAYSQDERDKMAESGMAMPDGSFPIKDEEDLRNAIQAYGRAKDKEAAKAHIMDRALALKKEDLIPENWIPKKTRDQFAGKSDEADEIEAEIAELALKRAYSDDEREKMAANGMAMPDGSFPIKDEEDLRNAIQAYGRAKNKDEAKAHIMDRALALKLEDLIPENWIPKKTRDEFSGSAKQADQEFVASLLEFEMLAAEEGLEDLS